jgi:predicted DNA binding CopG/RHH family protein
VKIIPGENMRKVKLTKQEKVIEEELLKDQYLKVDQDEFKAIAQAIASRKKDAVLNIRVNNNDLKNIKQKAQRLKLKYQTFISEILHRVAQTN